MLSTLIQTGSRRMRDVRDVYVRHVRYLRHIRHVRAILLALMLGSAVMAPIAHATDVFGVPDDAAPRPVAAPLTKRPGRGKRGHIPPDRNPVPLFPSDQSARFPGPVGPGPGTTAPIPPGWDAAPLRSSTSRTDEESAAASRPGWNPGPPCSPTRRRWPGSAGRSHPAGTGASPFLDRPPRSESTAASHPAGTWYLPVPRPVGPDQSALTRNRCHPSHLAGPRWLFVIRLSPPDRRVITTSYACREPTPERLVPSGPPRAG